METGRIEWLKRGAGYARVISTDNWDVREIVLRIRRDSEQRGIPGCAGPDVLITSNNPYFNYNTFNYYAQLERLPFRIEPSVAGNEAEWLGRAKARLETATYIIAKPGGAVWLYNSDAVLSALEAGTFPFTTIASFSMPDGTRSDIYRRREP